MEGLDCSGYVQIVLASVGVDPRGDQTCQTLYRYFMRQGCKISREAGALAFYGKSQTSIVHVGFCIDQVRMISAAGGDRNTTRLQHAIDNNAYVKVLPIDYRLDLVACIMPNYPDSLRWSSGAPFPIGISNECY